MNEAERIKDMKVSTAEVKTASAVSYMKQLCRHWGHKFVVQFYVRQGRIELPQAMCLLRASAEALGLRLEMRRRQTRIAWRGW